MSRRPRAPGDAGYLLLAVYEPEATWVFSTDPVQRLSLKTLAEALQAAEAACDPSRAAADPWFDGQPFGHTLVATPRGGTLLSEKKVLAIVEHWGQARPVAGGSRRGWLAAVAGGIVLAAAVALAAVYWPRTEVVIKRGAAPDVDISDASPAATAAGTLHVLAVGITTYRDATFSLRVAAADAEALAAALKGPLGC